MPESISHQDRAHSPTPRSNSSQYQAPCRGGRLWIDLTHWYFAVYSNPFESLSAFLFRHATDCKKAAESEGRLWAMSTGPLPKASLASVVLASVELLSARTLPLPQRLRIMRWINHLWSGCCFSGSATTSCVGALVQVRSGAVDVKVPGSPTPQNLFWAVFAVFVANAHPLLAGRPKH